MSIPTLPPKKPLKIHPTPFKPSLLSIPASPFSPLTPMTAHLPTPPPPTYHDSKPSSNARKPLSPLQWLWTCHQCRRTYALGVTRRCLEDGHFFCAGLSPTISWRKSTNPRKKKAGRACGSEFDYAGWKSWGRWRRSGQKSTTLPENPKSVAASLSAPPSLSSSPSPNLNSQDTKKPVLKTKKDCWKTCDYPSECRWGRQYGVHTPLTPTQPLTCSSILPITDNIPSLPVPPQPESQHLPTFEGILKSENVNAFDLDEMSNKKGEKKEKSDFWNALAKATLRRGATPSSPLARSFEEEDSSSKHAVDENGDAIMSQPVPSLQQSTSASSLVPTTLTGIIAKTKKSTRSRSRSKSKRNRNTRPSPQRHDSGMEVAPAAAIGHFEFGFDRSDDLDMDFAPLKRVRSRDSGYCSKLGSDCG